MKRSVILVIVAGFFLVTPAIFAQPAQQGEGMQQGMQGMQRKQLSPEEMAKKDEEMIANRVTELTQRLGLTAKQQQQVKEIMIKTGAAIRQVMSDAREKVKGFIKNDKEAVKALLTDEQKANLEQVRRSKE